MELFTCESDLSGWNMMNRNARNRTKSSAVNALSHEHVAAAEPEQAGNHEDAERFGKRARHRIKDLGAETGLCEVFVFGSKLRLLGLVHVEHLDNPDAVHRFVHNGRKSGYDFERTPAPAAHGFSDLHDEHAENGINAENEQREFGAYDDKDR